jgi:hypothetical protein
MEGGSITPRPTPNCLHDTHSAPGTNFPLRYSARACRGRVASIHRAAERADNTDQSSDLTNWAALAT